LVVIAAVVLATQSLAAGVAEAKILPYQLEVHPTRAEAGRPITVAVTLDPQNFLGEGFSGEIPAASTRRRRPNGGAFPIRCR
jgi:hypothetical protein